MPDLTGPDLSAAVARALGWTQGNRKHGEMPWYPPGAETWQRGVGQGFHPKYAEDLAVAWLVVEALRERGLLLTLRAMVDGYVADVWLAGECRCLSQIDAPTAPEAIAKAALLALQAQEATP